MQAAATGIGYVVVRGRVVRVFERGDLSLN